MSAVTKKNFWENIQNSFGVLSTQSTHAYLVDNLFLLVQIVEFKEVEVLNQPNHSKTKCNTSQIQSSA